MGVEKPDLFKQWKMMQDVDRILAEVATHAAAAGLDLEDGYSMGSGMSLDSKDGAENF